ncbi:MAG: SelB C-terminal domain-containing protein [Streptosporangiaceae bacterium]
MLEYLDRRGLTRRRPDDRRTVTGSGTVGSAATGSG